MVRVKTAEEQRMDDLLVEEWRMEELRFEEMGEHANPLDYEADRCDSDLLAALDMSQQQMAAKRPRRRHPEKDRAMEMLADYFRRNPEASIRSAAGWAASRLTNPPSMSN
ncbi:MAG: hypothetical protein WAO69_02660, partial [Aestuariivita sp.]|uniref:hypothetical protein n=1 Tax=Aestuariivita sp. TaxID=1872407 RepID=UPI003BAFF2CE